MQLLRLNSLVVVVVAALLGTGAALKCYQGTPDQRTESDCTGSCLKASKGNDVGMLCSPEKTSDGCITVEEGSLCSCNTDLCNTSSPTSRPSLLLLVPLLASFLLPCILKA